MNDVVKLVIAIVVSELAGIIGGVATASSVSTWYVALRKPPFTPPSWVFGPVWTTLYAMMGVAAWLVWRMGLEKPTVRTALTIFLVQLALNTLWSLIFFGLRAPGWAFLEIIFLWSAIVLTTVRFFRLSIVAGALMLPYIAWVSFASVLNYYLWRLNA